MIWKRIAILFSLSFILFSLSPKNTEAADPIFQKTILTEYDNGSSDVFYTNDGKVKVSINITSILENTKNNTLQVTLLKPGLLGGLSVVETKRYSTLGLHEFEMDFEEYGYYRINLGLGGSTGFGTPVRFYSNVKVYD